MARSTYLRHTLVVMFPESVNHSLLDNFIEKEFFCNGGQVDLICTNLNQPQGGRYN
jgi:hypothetical protein